MILINYIKNKIAEYKLKRLIKKGWYISNITTNGRIESNDNPDWIIIDSDNDYYTENYMYEN